VRSTLTPLPPPQPHPIRPLARGANIEGAGESTLRQRVRPALRLRPDLPKDAWCVGRKTAERAAAHGVQSVSLEHLLAKSAVVSLHLVPSAATRQLINAERLATMRPDSLLVNTSRSALIDTNALVDALRAGRPAFAALDVFDTEPLPHDAPLRSLPNVLLTPHLGFVTEPVFAQFAHGVVQHVQTWLRAQGHLAPAD
jgi:phosphoglycerate dehydrogenase-like enzyme